MNTDSYIRQSLELHLFFGRIMKEHALFLKAGFAPPNADFAKKAEFYKREFEQLLHQAIAVSAGAVSCEVLQSCAGSDPERQFAGNGRSL